MIHHVGRSDHRFLSNCSSARQGRHGAVYEVAHEKLGVHYVLDGRPIEEVAAEFNLTNNAVSQIKTRVTRMIDHWEAVYSA